MGNNSYLALAKRDLQNAKELFDVTTTGYNLVVRLSQQAVEKIMKHFIEELGFEKFRPLLSSHNTVSLYSAILELGVLSEDFATKREMIILKSYYFDTDYPGENYIEIDRHSAKDALNFAQGFVDEILEYEHDSGGNSEEDRVSVSEVFNKS